MFRLSDERIERYSRQIILHEIGGKGQEKLPAHNSDLRLTASNILDIVKNYDIIIDRSDNFTTRYLVNDACVLSKKPLIHAGILRFDGQATETLKYILHCGELLVCKLLVFNALNMSFRTLTIKRDKNCPICGNKPTTTKLIDYEQFCGLNRPQSTVHSPQEMEEEK